MEDVRYSVNYCGYSAVMGWTAQSDGQLVSEDDTEVYLGKVQLNASSMLLLLCVLCVYVDTKLDKSLSNVRVNYVA